MDNNNRNDIAQLILLELERLHESHEKLDDKMDNIDKTLLKQELNLQEHMRRSLAAEEGIGLLRDSIKPLQTHVNLVQFSTKALMWLLGSGGMVALIRYLISN